MSVAVDFLPAAYRARQQLAQQRRHRAWLAVPIVAALFATDAVLVHRVELAATMAANARAHADQQEQRADQVRQLAARLAEQQHALETAAAPLRLPRLGATVDALLTATPGTVALQEVHCRLQPWQPSPQAVLRVVAGCPGAEQLEQYLLGLRDEELLPPLQCTRTFRGPNGLGFELESTIAASPR